MDERLARAVRVRAGFICEYCRLPQALHLGVFEIEHIIALQHRGPTVPGNLAYACFHCNRHKGPNLASIDRQTSRTRLVRLFNPRRHIWSYHFAWDGPRIVGRTPIGRVTVRLLDMNSLQRIELREALMATGLFRPGG